MAELAHGVRTQVGLVVVDLQSNLESKDFIQLEFPNFNLCTSINLVVNPYPNTLIANLEAMVDIVLVHLQASHTYFEASCHNQVTKFLVVATWDQSAVSMIHMQPSKANHNSLNVLEVVAFLAMVRRTFNQNSQFANMVPINEVLMDFSNSSKFNG